MDLNQSEKNKNEKKAPHTLISVLLLAIVLFTGYQMITARISEKRAEAEYEELAIKAGGIIKTELTEAAEKEEERPYPHLDIDTEELLEINSDFVGWLYFPALEISYPMVQGEDNDYYLKRSFEGAKLNAGSIFMDYAAAADWSDRNTFVFGHNMRDSSMFGSFKYLEKEPSLYEDDPWFYIYTSDTVYIYRIFSCYQTKASSDRYMTFTSDESYDAYVKWALENSVFESNADLSERKNIVSLSTCYGAVGGSSRILIHGVLTAAEPY